MTLRRSALAAMALLSASVALSAEAPKVAPAEAAKLVAQGKAVLVDVREPTEWQETGVAAPAELLAKSDFDGERKQWDAFLARNADKQILVYCRTGRRSGAVANALAEKGIKAGNVGGLKDWTDAGLPTRTLTALRAWQERAFGESRGCSRM